MPASIPPEAPQQICQALGATLHECLGAGAAKQTYRINMPGKGPFALKILDGAFPQERLEREIEAMRSCDHDGVAQLYEVNKIGVSGLSVTYILEEYLDGGSLADRLKGGACLAPNETRRILLSLSEAVAHLQARSLVHRDIKPDNIMFRRNSETPVLVDFGIVRNLSKDSLTLTHAAMGPGTPFYAAPEQLRNDKYQIDWRTDQFSLGVVGSMCVLGSHPYQRSGDTPAHTVERVSLRQKPRPGFTDEVQAHGLEGLARTVEPWSVRRFRLPAELIAIWR